VLNNNCSVAVRFGSLTLSEWQPVNKKQRMAAPRQRKIVLVADAE
jgi:hypothetical protein